jgi:hypothetical protein
MEVLMTKPVFMAVTPELLAREGLTETIAPWEDGLRIDTAPGSFEWWYFDAHFDNGSTAVLVFATKPLLERSGRLKPNVSLTITRPDGTKVSQFPIFPPEQFSASKETCDVRIGPNWTKGDLHTYRVHVEMDGLAADLTFTGLVPPWRPGVGKSFFGDMDHFFAWLPSIPHGVVLGTLTYDGQTLTITGTGYHDHNWGNVGLNEVMDHWYWGRAHIGEYTLIYVEQMAAKEYGYIRMPVFMLAKGDRILTGDGLPLTMTTADFVHHPDGRSYPREVDFHWLAEAGTIHIRLRQAELIEGISLLLTFPAWQRRLIRLFANPYYFRFNANLELSINLDDNQTTQGGPALFEIMILQGRNHP